MNNTKISVIIPVYNVQKYLRQCLDSIINQTLKEIEIICVNDGSTDDSLIILEEYASKDDRIRIINKKNGGVGAARNSGIEVSTGEYIGFVDSDDWVELTAYEKLYKNAKSQNSDIVMCPINVFDDITKELKFDLPYFTLECFDKQFDNRIFNHKDTKDFLFLISVTAWNKIYKTEFLNKINARFPENLIFEDNPFFYETFLKASNVSLIRDFLYFYRINRNDSIISKEDKKFFDIIKILDSCRKIFIDTNNYDSYKTDLLNHMISSFIRLFIQVDESNKQEFFDLIKKYFENIALKNDDINKLSLYSKNDYQNIMDSYSYREFELRKKLQELENEKINLSNKLNIQKQTYEERLQTSSNKLNIQKQTYEERLQTSENEKINLSNKLNIQKQTYEERLQTSENEKQVYNKKLMDKEKIIQKIISSNSWKITKPPRKIGTWLRNQKKS